MDKDPIDWQERHSPTEQAEITVNLASGRKGKHPARRRRADNRVWDSMTPAQTKAAEWIERGYRAITGHLDYATMPQDRVDKTHDSGHSDILVTAEKWYFEWGRECVRESPIMHPVTIAYLAENLTFREIARRYRRRGETISKLFYDGLDLFAKLRRWG